MRLREPNGTNLWQGRLLFITLVMAGLFLVAQTSATWAQPHQNPLRDTVNTPVPTSTLGPTSTPVPLPSGCAKRVVLTQGSAYNGTSDSWMDALSSYDPRSEEQRLILGVRGGSEGRSSLVRFDLNGYVPGNADVISAELLFNVDTLEAVQPLNVAAYRLLRAWNADQVTWRERLEGAAWSQMGANQSGVDRAATADDTITLAQRGVVRGLNVTASVRYFLQHPGENYGWLIQGDASTPAVSYQFPSSLSTETRRRPALRVDYRDCSLVLPVIFKVAVRSATGAGE